MNMLLPEAGTSIPEKHSKAEDQCLIIIYCMSNNKILVCLVSGKIAEVMKF